MKIVILSDDFPPVSFGGAGIIAYVSAKKLAERGHEVTVITTVKEQASAGERQVDGFKVISLESDYADRWRHYVSLWNMQLVKKVDELLKTIQPDVVHAHNIHTHLSYKSLALARKYTTKVFLTAHDVMSVHYGKLVVKTDTDLRISALKQLAAYKFQYNPFRNAVIKHYLKNVAPIFAVSNAVKAALEANGIRKVITLHNGIDLAEWMVDAQQVEDLKKELNLQDKKVIFYGGRLSGLKGTNAVIAAFRKVLEEVPNTRLLMVGVTEHATGTLKKKLQGIENKIIFSGWVDRQKIKLFYAASDVVTVPSLYLDPFPTVNLEAMALHKPVVGTRYGGTPEVVEDDKTGYIIDPNDVNDFADKLTLLLKDDSKAKMFGGAGYERIQKYFTLDKHIDELLSWYNKPSK